METIAKTLVSMAGSSSGNVVVVHREIVEFLCGDFDVARVFEQLLYWHSVVGDRWIAKSAKEFEVEIYVRRHTLDKARKVLEERGLVETKRARFNNAPTVHWRVNFDALAEQWEAWLEYKNSPDLQKSAKRFAEICKSLTKNTTEKVYDTYSANTQGSEKDQRRKLPTDEKVEALRKKLASVGNTKTTTSENRERLTKLSEAQYKERLYELGYGDYEWLIAMLPKIAKATGKRKGRLSTVGEAKRLVEAVKTLSEAGFSDNQIRETLASRCEYYAEQNAGKMKPILTFNRLVSNLASEKNIERMRSYYKRSSKPHKEKLLSEKELAEEILKEA